MAGPLTAVERFFERLFERPAARIFQPQLEVVQIQRALEREMESERHAQRRRSYVPTEYRVLLNDNDAAALGPDLKTLTRDLAEGLRVYARSHGYVLLAQPRVEIGSSAAVPPSDVRAYAQPVVVPASAGAPRPPRPVVQHDQPRTPPPEVSGQATSSFQAPRTIVPSALLTVHAPGADLVRVAVRGGTTRIGRTLDNDIVLHDGQVSRHHGQIGARLGMLVYTDLGSTNGSFLNGSRVTEIALGTGDVLQLGRSTVTIEPTP